MVKRLQFADKLAVVEWLRANKAALMEKRPTLEAVCHRVGKELKHELSAQTLRAICRDAGVEWSQPHGGRTPATVQQLQQDLLTVAEAVADLYEDLGKESDVDFMQLYNRLTKANRNHANDGE